MHYVHKITLITSLTSLLVFSACGDSSFQSSLGGGSAGVQILLTDAPSDYIGSAEVSISSVTLKVRDEDGADRIELLPDSSSPQVYDLMELRDGVQALLADSSVPAAEYKQLRLIVDHATVTLAEGLTFRDGSTTAELSVPSGMQSGIKVELTEPIQADDGTLTILVVDFDVNENFVLQGNPETPAGIHGVQFKPVLKEISRNRE